MHTKTTEICLLAKSIPLSQIPTGWQLTNLPECLEECLEEAAQAAFHRDLEILLAMEKEGQISKWQIAQILFETSKLGR